MRSWRASLSGQHIPGRTSGWFQYKAASYVPIETDFSPLARSLLMYLRSDSHRPFISMPPVLTIEPSVRTALYREHNIEQAQTPKSLQSNNSAKGGTGKGYKDSLYTSVMRIHTLAKASLKRCILRGGTGSRQVSLNDGHTEGGSSKHIGGHPGEKA